MTFDNQKTFTKEALNAISPAEALELLKNGNERFVSGNTLQRNALQQVKETENGQAPFAAVLGCIDSRVPAEVVFDQGIGDLFNVRIAGNFVNDDILGSLEFACKVVGSKVIVVLGHSSCGAVKGTINKVELGNLTGLLSNIEPAVGLAENQMGAHGVENEEFVQRVADINVSNAIEDIKKKSPILKAMAEEGSIQIVGAMYHVDSGKVTYF